jgi:mitogen-activated protein kinase kinase
MSSSHIHTRPSGPRNPNSTSATPSSIRPVQPLNIRKLGLSLQIPLKKPHESGPSSHASNESPSDERPRNDDDAASNATLQPHERTIKPSNSTTVLDILKDVNSSTEKFTSGINTTNPHYQEKWSNDDLEELVRLGEGAGGAVYKVKVKQTGAILARKTITTNEAPMIQVLRELKFMSNTYDENIVTFYGAYGSPSSSEVNILMEYGEGGSLESIGKRIRSRGGRIAEKPASQLARGVCILTY